MIAQRIIARLLALLFAGLVSVLAVAPAAAVCTPATSPQSPYTVLQSQLELLEEVCGNTNLDNPLSHGGLVTPSDSVNLTNPSRACIIATAGDVKVTTLGGETFVIPSVTAGQFLPMRFSRIWSTGTTASNISCWW